MTNHYDDASDETAWTSTLKTDGITLTKRYVDDIDGNLSATVADDGTVKLALTNLHGDTVATIDPDATSIASYHETTEYGLPRDAASAADDYGWAGCQEALQRRPRRPYASWAASGSTTQPPAASSPLTPSRGGNANAYTYPLDPIDDFDTNGRFWGKIIGTVVKVAVEVANYSQYVPGAVGSVSSTMNLISDIKSAHSTGNWLPVAQDGLDLVTSYLAGKAVSKIADKIATSYGNRVAVSRGSRMLERHRSPWDERYVKKSVKSITGSAAAEIEKNLQSLNQGRIDKQKNLYARRHHRRQ